MHGIGMELGNITGSNGEIENILVYSFVLQRTDWINISKQQYFYLMVLCTVFRHLDGIRKQYCIITTENSIYTYSSMIITILLWNCNMKLHDNCTDNFTENSQCILVWGTQYYSMGNTILQFTVNIVIIINVMTCAFSLLSCKISLHKILLMCWPIIVTIILIYYPALRTSIQL